MVRKDVVCVAEMLHDGNAIGLLSHAGVRGPVQETGLEQLQQPLLKAADEAHSAVQQLITGVVM